jgi:hypothetical protein
MPPGGALADGREAVNRPRRYRTASAIVLPAQREAMGVVAPDDGWIPQHIAKCLVDAGHPAPEPVSGRAEHTFGRLGERSDGKNQGPGHDVLRRRSQRWGDCELRADALDDGGRELGRAR